MTAVATYDDYKQMAMLPHQLLPCTKGSPSLATGRVHSMWVITQADPGVAPSTAAVPVSTTAGAIRGFENSTNQQFLARIISTSNTRNGYILADRLSHQGGLSAIVTTEQTTNLPTAALTRYTSGVGVMVGLEIYTQIGTTGTTVTANYTNQAGTAARTTKAAVFGGTNFREVNRLILLPLQDGDTGVRSVEGVTVLATTGTAGNFGVTLFKPLFPYSCDLSGMPYEYDGLLRCGFVPEIVNDACLWWLVIGTLSPGGPLQGNLHIIEP